MKNYYQSQKSAYKLPKPIYAKIVKTIQSYDFYRCVIDTVDSRSETSVGEIDAVNKATAAYYIENIDRALESCVHEEYRNAVFEHTAREVEYSLLEEQYGISVSTMKRWTQRFVYGVAVNLGEDFPDYLMEKN